MTPVRSTERITPSPTLVPSARLGRLRAAVLAAPYGICTTKAERLTEFLAARWGSGLTRALGHLHGRAFAAGLADQAAGRPLARWKSRLATAIVSASRSHELPNAEAIEQDLAEGLAHVLRNAPLRLYPDELIVGNASSRRVGAPLHPDYGGLLLAGELDTISTRPQNPLHLDESQRRALHERIVPFWARRSVLSTWSVYSDDPSLADELIDGRALVLTQIAGISHLTPDYPSVVRLGLRGLLAQIEARREAIDAASATHPSAAQRRQRSFLVAASTSLDAVVEHAHRWVAHLRDRARLEPTRADELLEAAAVLDRVPEHPARTLREGLQAVWLVHATIHAESFQHGVSFGRMDQYLFPLLEADFAAGRLDRAGAVELIGCFLVKAAELLPLFFDRATEYFSGLSSASGITLGGVAEYGRDASNELSLLFLEAYDQVRLRQPNLHVRLHPRTDPALKALAHRVISGGGGMPALFNDDAIRPALEASGLSVEEAADYAIVGCAEWGAPYRSFPAAGAIFLNLPALFLRALRDGRDEEGRTVGPRTGSAASFRDLDAILRAFVEQLRHLLRRAVRGNDAIELAHAEHRPTPLLSALVRGCVDKGRDVTRGGAQINTVGVQCVGLADLVDSLAALEHAVFAVDNAACTIEELIEALDRDFEGHEILRARLRSKSPRHGAGDASVDALTARVTRCIVDEVSRFRPARGGRCVAGLWCMTTHQGFGARTGALPSGRHAGAPLANGAAPAAGSRVEGPTGALASCAAVTGVPNGLVVNQSLAPSMVRAASGQRTLLGLVDGYFAMGGMQLQIDVLDPAVLRAARERPEAHRDLVVRISGYSAYFCDLTPAMQDEIITRAESAAGCR